MGKRNEEHAFSIEMNSESCVRKMSLFDRENGHVFFEGFLGELKSFSIIEGVMLEIEGVNGTLKLDVKQEEIEQCIAPKETIKHGDERQ